MLNEKGRSELKIFLVGGAVRDGLLGRVPKDRDFLVLDSSHSEMINHGFIPVGKEFSVYLHPQTREEYALTRGRHAGLETIESTSLEDDLARRDFTINAIAQNIQTGECIDPLGGHKDLKEKKLRSLPGSLEEDPVRVLRLARFFCRLEDFSVVPETMETVDRLVEGGVLRTLPPDRVWLEFSKALGEKKPDLFFKFIIDTGILQEIFPDITFLFQDKLGLFRNCRAAAELKDDITVRFSVLFPSVEEECSKKYIQIMKALFVRIKTPKTFQEGALLFNRYQKQCSEVFTLPGDKIVEILDGLRAFHFPDNLTRFLNACEADGRGRLCFEGNTYPQAIFLRDAYEKAAQVQGSDILQVGVSPGRAFGEALKQERAKRIEEVMKSIQIP